MFPKQTQKTAKQTTEWSNVICEKHKNTTRPSHDSEIEKNAETAQVGAISKAQK